MDQSTVLQLLDSELKKIKDSCNVLTEFSDVKKSICELINESECKNQAFLKDTVGENEELSKEILALEKELSQLEKQCSKEASSLAMQQKIADDQAREMKMMDDIKAQYNNRLAKAHAKPSKKDLDLLEKCRKKLEAYAKLTGVDWDFDSCDKNTLSGYVRNATDTKMKIFNININGKSREEIVDEMWKVIKKYSKV
ncbi:unnamed protein product [Nezara viridula]|uniref:Kinetochore protein Spc24 n=1 Tax=Nezara viridula TaxID=85310 RepID=A0A9P0MSZ6_NEZVI|nr:unnamed protein product [Nezara viridula]